MKTYKGRGVVLHTLKYGDSSMVVYLLTDTGGRRSYMVQGVRSRNGRGSKLALFQPMFPVEFEGLESSRQQMHRFKEVQGGFVLQSLPFDVRKSTMALFMAEVLYRLVREYDEPNQALFDFVWNSVGALDSMDEGVANFHLWFLANLSRFLGFCPGNDYSADDWFDIREGLYTKTRPQHVSFMTQECTRILRYDGVRRTLPGRNRSQPYAARRVPQCRAGLFRLPSRRHQRGAVGADSAGSVLREL